MQQRPISVIHATIVQEYWRKRADNTTGRIVGNQDVTLTLDVKTHLTSMIGCRNNAALAYHGDGGRGKATFDGTTTIYLDAHYETVDGTVVK